MWLGRAGGLGGGGVGEEEPLFWGCRLTFDLVALELSRFDIC